MNTMLAEPHPFANQPRAGVPAGPQPVAPAPRVSQRRSQAPAAAPNAGREREVAQDPSGWNYKDLFSEVRVGALAHDMGPFSASDEGGVDANLELLFTSPDLFEFMWSPRPHVGVSINSGDDTSQAYLGLTWEWSFWGGWFAGFSLGGMVHDGHLVGVDGESKSLGCRFLFRESVNAGYRFNNRHAVMFHFDHSSNASLCEKNISDGSEHGREDTVLNEGLENIGIRYGYTF